MKPQEIIAFINANKFPADTSICVAIRKDAFSNISMCIPYIKDDNLPHITVTDRTNVIDYPPANETSRILNIDDFKSYVADKLESDMKIIVHYSDIEKEMNIGSFIYDGEKHSILLSVENI